MYLSAEIHLQLPFHKFVKTVGPFHNYSDHEVSLIPGSKQVNLNKTMFMRLNAGSGFRSKSKDHEFSKLEPDNDMKSRFYY